MNKSIISLVFLCTLLCSQGTVLLAQSTSPDKLISYIRDKGDAYAFTFPGWLIRAAGNIADKNLDENEGQMVRELTSHIKKIRFVVSEQLPAEFDGKYSDMLAYLKKKKYEPLIEARDGNTNVNIWGLFDNNIIKRLIISTVEEGHNSTLFNIKSDIDIIKLQSLPFFKKLKAKNDGAI